MKTYTTPTIKMTVKGAADLLENAQSVIVTMRCENGQQDFVPSIEGTELSWTLTQEQTAQMCGRVDVEATIKANDGSVAKTETKKFSIEHAVKECEV